MTRPPPPRRRLGATALAPLAALAVALPACVMVPPGIRVAKPEETDRVAVQAPPAGWKRIAVVPFGGDAAHRRPAEEQVAVALQHHVPFAVLGPFALQRRLRETPAAAILLEAGAWAPAFVDSGGAELPRDRLRALAEAAGADALVLGFVAPGGASTDLVLVDPSTGVAVAALRRAGDPAASERGVHELAMEATRRALVDLVEVLRTAPGARPRVEPPGTRPATWSEVVP